MCFTGGDELAEQAREAVRVFEVREVTSALEHLDTAVGECALDAERVRGRDHPVLGAPHDQGRDR